MKILIAIISRKLIAQASCVALFIFLIPASSVAQQRSTYDLAAWIIAGASDNDTTSINWALKEGGDIDFKRAGMNALHTAIFFKRTAMVKFLLDKGANPLVLDEDGKNALQLAEKGGNPEIILMLKNKMGISTAAIQAPEAVKETPKQAEANMQVNADVPVNTTAPANNGRLKVNDVVLYSRDRGRTWGKGTVKEVSMDPNIITDNQPLYLIEDQAKISKDYYDRSYITTLERQPGWTSFFVGDWNLYLPIAATERVIDRDVYQVISGGDRLPPLRINANGTYSWVIDSKKILRGKWKPNNNAPGIILMAADRGADWLMYNTSNANNRKIYKTDYVMIVTESHYTTKHGFRLTEK